jgi:hypothetical protein
MAQTFSEITKDIVIAAIQNGYLNKNSSGMSTTVETANADNIVEIQKFYKAVYAVVKESES